MKHTRKAGLKPIWMLTLDCGGKGAAYYPMNLSFVELHLADLESQVRQLHET